MRHLFEHKRIITEGSKFEDGAIMKPPNKRAILLLANSCDVFRRNAEIFASDFAGGINRLTEILRAVAILHKHLPGLIDCISVEASDSPIIPETTAEKIKAELSAWGRLYQSIDSAKTILSRSYRFDPTAAPSLPDTPQPIWHWLAEVLVWAFLDAMRSTNPDRELRLSNTGPASRFLEAIIPLVTWESVKGETVIRYVERNGQ